jgi:hypothetical protein
LERNRKHFFDLLLRKMGVLIFGGKKFVEKD